MAALSGGCIGFLPYNLNPAKIFMGDTGSTFLGFILAVVVSIQGLFKSYAIISFAVPFLMLGLPIFDTCFAIFRRVSHGQSPHGPDRGHIHHRLIDMGFSQKQAVAVLYVISAILGLSAVVLTTTSVLKAMMVLLALCVAGGLSAKLYLDRVNHREPLSPLPRTAPRPAPWKLRQPLEMWRATTTFRVKRSDLINETCHCYDDFRHPAGGHQDGPLALELSRRPGLNALCCVTAQHREMLDSGAEHLPAEAGL